MFRKLYLLFLVTIYCNPLPIGFTSKHLYTRNNFDGSELNEKSIGICPLLGKDLHDSVRFLSSDSQFLVLKNTRPDLYLISVKETEKQFLNILSHDSLMYFYNKLQQSGIISLQTDNVLWDAIKTDYYLVIRMINASSITTFNKNVRKRLNLEAELWNCKEREVVWRTGMRGIGLSKDISDKYFIMEAIKKLLLEIPVLLPSNNGGDSW